MISFVFLLSIQKRMPWWALPFTRERWICRVLAQAIACSERDMRVGWMTAGEISLEVEERFGYRFNQIELYFVLQKMVRQGEIIKRQQLTSRLMVAGTAKFIAENDKKTVVYRLRSD